MCPCTYDVEGIPPVGRTRTGRSPGFVGGLRHGLAMDLAIAFVVLLSLVVGIALGWLFGLSSARARQAMSHQFRALSADAVAESGKQVVAPVKESLDRFDERLREMERSHVSAQSSLRAQVESVQTSSEGVRRETAALVTALRRPQVRGRWGELHLKKAVELAGLVERCDFTLQPTSTTADGTLRPDLVVHLAGGKHVVVDAKVPLDAFLDAAQSDDESVRSQRLAAHARQVRAHVETLAGKAYWKRFDPAPEFVVLFVPAESFLSHALEADPGLLEHAAARKVVLATPTTLIALLRTVAFAWTQESVADSSREIHMLAKDLYERLCTMGSHLDKLGRSLTGAVRDYNKSVGSLETRVLVSARKLRDLDVCGDEIPTPSPVIETVRPISAPELQGELGFTRRLASGE